MKVIIKDYMALPLEIKNNALVGVWHVISTSGFFFTNQFSPGPRVGNLLGPFRIWKNSRKYSQLCVYRRWQAVHRWQRHIIASVVLLVPTLLRYRYMLALHSEMENISTGPTFGDFFTIRTRCRTSRLQDYRVKEYRLPSPPVTVCTAWESLCGQ